MESGSRAEQNSSELNQKLSPLLGSFNTEPKNTFEKFILTKKGKIFVTTNEFVLKQ